MERDLKKITYWIFFISVFTILLTFIAYYINDYISKEQLDTEKLGHFGDFVGGLVGVFLTFLATLLIYHTYNSQKKELELSRELFSKQNFENTFFNMLNVHQKLPKEISFDTGKNGIFGYNEIIPNEIVRGKSFFEFAQNDFMTLWKYEYDDSKINTIFDKISSRHEEYGYKYEPHSSMKISDSEGKFVDNTTEVHLKDIIELKYPIFWKNYANYIGDYFRNIYHILKYLSNEKSKEINITDNQLEIEIIKEKYKKYADILQSQMSYSELFFMFYNALTFTKVKQYIEEFDFIQNLFVKNLLHPKHAEFEGMGNIKIT